MWTSGMKRQSFEDSMEYRDTPLKALCRAQACISSVGGRCMLPASREEPPPCSKRACPWMLVWLRLAKFSVGPAVGQPDVRNPSSYVSSAVLRRAGRATHRPQFQKLVKSRWTKALTGFWEGYTCTREQSVRVSGTNCHPHTSKLQAAWVSPSISW